MVARIVDRMVEWNEAYFWQTTIPATIRTLLAFVYQISHVGDVTNQEHDALMLAQAVSLGGEAENEKQECGAKANRNVEIGRHVDRQRPDDRTDAEDPEYVEQV